MFDSAKPSQKLNFWSCSDETGGTYQPERCIPLPFNRGGFGQYDWNWGPVDGFCRHWRKPKGVNFGI